MVQFRNNWYTLFTKQIHKEAKAYKYEHFYFQVQDQVRQLFFKIFKINKKKIVGTVAWWLALV